MQNAERRMQNFGTLRFVWKNTPITEHLMMCLILSCKQQVCKVQGELNKTQLIDFGQLTEFFVFKE